MPRLVLITNDSLHGQRVLQTAWQRGIVLDAVLYLVGSVGIPPARRGVGLGTRVLRWPRSAASAAKRTLVFHRRRRASYAARCARVIGTGAMNSRRMLRDLRALEPDWVILAGGGIARPEVIGAARLGVLNAHPALLPWVRGVGVTGASLEHGVALGATLHHVDPGIDTGAIVERRLLAVPAAETSLAELDRRCFELASEMMADAIEAIAGGGELPTGTPQPVRYPLFGFPTTADVERQIALAAGGRAHELYEAWRPLCIDPGRGLLPAHFGAPPTVTLTPLPAAKG